MSLLSRFSTRRAWLAAAALALLPASQAWAQFRVEISGVGATQVPVAIAKFKAEGMAPQAISAIIKADLERSGQFKMLDVPGDKLGKGVGHSNNGLMKIFVGHSGCAP